MAIISKIVALAAAFAALSSARPLAIREVTDMVTETKYTTVDVPVTVWVNEQGEPLSTVAQGGAFAAVTPTPAAQSPAPAAASPQVIQSASPITPSAVVVPTTTAAPVMATSPPAWTTPSVTTPAATTPAPVAQTTPAAPTTSAAAPAPASTSSSPATNSGSSGQTGTITGSTTATCQGEGNACSGDITNWGGGLGACGWDVNTSSDMQIALPFEFMGTQSNGNPYCGKSLSIQSRTGQIIQATVGDKCMGCDGRSIDLTEALFAAVGDGCDGRCHDIAWWFN